MCNGHVTTRNPDYPPFLTGTQLMTYFLFSFQQSDFHGNRVAGLKSALQLITLDPLDELTPLLKAAQEEYDSKYS